MRKHLLILVFVFAAGMIAGVFVAKLGDLIFFREKIKKVVNADISLAELQSASRLLGIEYLRASHYGKNQLNEISLALAKNNQRIKILSFNILFDLHDQSTPKEHQWPRRLSRVSEIIKNSGADIIGLQEPQINQIKDLEKKISKKYQIITISNKIQKLNPENNFSDAIMFRKDRFSLREKNIIFASKTPEIPSKYKKARFPTVSQIVKLWDQVTQKEFVFINTHFDFFSPDIREISAKNICDYIQKKYNNLPVILGGDLNLFPAWPRRKVPFQDGDYLLRLFEQNCNLVDARRVSLLGHLGPISTYTNSADYPKKAFKGLGVPGVMLDRILVNKYVQVLIHGVNTKRFENNKFFASDHLPVFSVVLIK